MEKTRIKLSFNSRYSVTLVNNTIEPLRVMLFTTYWLLVDQSISRAYVGNSR